MDIINKDKYLYNSYNPNNMNFNIDKFNISHYIVKHFIDLSYLFEQVLDQGNLGITSACSITSVMSYYYKKKGNDKEFSPYFLAYQQNLVTNSWNNIDIFTGLNIIKNFGIITKDGYDNFINNNFHINDLLKYKLNNFSTIDFNVDNLQIILSNDIPILCSIKILPYNNKFYNFFNDINFWINVNNHYNINFNNIYAVSVVIVGYDSKKRLFKVRGCWGNKVGDNGYFYINYDIINIYASLFFDYFIIDDYVSSISKSTSIDNMQVFNDFDNDEITIEINTPISPNRINNFYFDFDKYNSTSYSSSL